MSNLETPENIHCTRSHEYVIVDGETGIIGITQYATEQLGEIVYVELPEVGTTIPKGEAFGTVESVKAASEIYMPVSGTISEINHRLTSEPELINDDCYNEGWIIKVADFSKEDLEEAMPMDEYLSFIEE
ncbi:MAG: glycine cleavage system protein GcvH [Cyanobacteriota bacterium]